MFPHNQNARRNDCITLNLSTITPDNSFNRATFEKTWKQQQKPDKFREALELLQSSHVFSNVETSLSLCCASAASLPLQSSHVFSNVETPRRCASGDSRLARFNRATFFQTWKLDGRRSQQLCFCVASIEPRFFKRGNIFVAWPTSAKRCCFNRATFFQTWKRIMRSIVVNAAVELQSSHVFSNVETI